MNRFPIALGLLVLTTSLPARDLDRLGTGDVRPPLSPTTNASIQPGLHPGSPGTNGSLILKLLAGKKTGWNQPVQNGKSSDATRWTNRADSTNEHSLLVSLAGRRSVDEKGVPIPSGSSGRVEIIASGMHYNDGSGLLRESVESFEPSKDGFMASKGIHRAFVRAVLDEKPAFRVDDKENGIVEGRVLGLGYFDADSGKSVLIAPVQSVRSSLIASNVVEFPSCFRGINASLRYVYRRSGFAQDLVINGPVPSPAAYGLSEKAVIEVWTELSSESSTASPSDRAVLGKSVKDSAAKSSDATSVDDNSFHFGRLKMAQGSAFQLNQTNVAESIPVGKRIMEQDGRRILIEAIPWKAFDKAVGDKPRASLPTRNDAASFLVHDSSRRAFPGLKSIPLATDEKAAYLAQNTGTASDPFVIDFEIITGSLNNFTFRADTTYRIEGPTYLAGTTVFEAGAVIKFADPSTYAGLTVNGQAMFKGTPFQPVVFTAGFDNSIGQVVAEPQDYNYGTAGAYMLRLSAYSNGGQPNGLVKNVVFRHAQSAVEFFGGDYSQKHSMINARFYKCQNAITVYYGAAYVGNALFFDPISSGTTSSSTIYYPSPSSSLLGEHWTVHHAYKLTGGYSAYYDYSLMPTLRNCILADVYQPYAFYSSSDTVITYDPDYFSKAGLGEHYLSDSRAQNIGQYNIDGRLWTEFQNHTTQPPIILSGIVKGGSRFGPRTDVRNDPLVPGYHYPRVDYLVDDLDFDTGEHRILPGTRVAVATSRLLMGNGFFKPPVILWGKDCSVSIGGSKFNEAVLLRDSAIHEIPDVHRSLEISGLAGLTQEAGGLTPKITLNGVKMLDYYGSSPLLGSEWTTLSLSFSATDSEFYGVNFGILMCNAWSACCQIDRSVLQGCRLFAMDASQADYTLSFKARNNAFKRTDLLFLPLADNVWELTDNIIEECRLVGHGLQQGVPNSQPFPGQHHNAWLNTTDRWTPAQSTDQALASLTWNAGPLGNFYLPQDNEALIGKGSKTFAQAGLAHYTSNGGQQTPFRLNPVPAVDIGPCFPVVNSFTGKLIDSDGDGIPDNAEDRNGNGIVDWFETSFLAAQSDPLLASDMASEIYEDWSLDEDSMSVREQLKIALSPANNDNPLDLAYSPMPLGGAAQLAVYVAPGFELTGLRVLANGEAIPQLASLPPTVSGSIPITIDTDALPNGWQNLQVAGTLRRIGTGSAVIGWKSAARMFCASNAVSIAPMSLGNDLLSRGFPVLAETEVLPVEFALNAADQAEYSLKIYKRGDILVREMTGLAGRGVNELVWDGKDQQGNLVTHDGLKLQLAAAWPTFAAASSGAPGAGTAAKQKYIPTVGPWPSKEAGWVIRYQDIFSDYAPDSGKQRVYSAINKIGQTAWRLHNDQTDTDLIPPIPLRVTLPDLVTAIPYGNNVTTNSVTAGYSLLTNDLAQTEYRNAWLYAHGAANAENAGIGGWRETDVGNRSCILASVEVAKLLKIPHSGSSPIAYPPNAQPYRFVFIDGCETAKNSSFADAFGVRTDGKKYDALTPFQTVDNGARKWVERPKVFIGWSRSQPFARKGPNSKLIQGPIVLLERFVVFFSSGIYTVGSSIEHAVRGTGFGLFPSELLPGVNIDTHPPFLIDTKSATYPNGFQGYAEDFRIIGYARMRLNDFNHPSLGPPL